MKTNLFLLVVLFVTTRLAYCDPNFDGDWQGQLTVAEKGDVFLVRIVINGNEATQYFGGKDGTWKAVEPVQSDFFANRNNAILVWQNIGGLWSETQVFSLSYLGEGRLDVQWLRHVNNLDKGEYTTWNLKGSGALRKSAE